MDPLIPRGARRGARLALVTGGLTTALVTSLALPAAAAGGGVGGVGDAYTPSPLSMPVLLGLFIGVPLAGFVVAGLLSFRPSRASKAGYRPGRAWDHDTQWFGTPPQREDDERRMALPHAGGARGRW